MVQEHEFNILVSFNTKSNQGLTIRDDVMDILEQHQVVCTMKLWYQKIFMGNLKEGHNCQYICQYAINFRD